MFSLQKFRKPIVDTLIFRRTVLLVVSGYVMQVLLVTFSSCDHCSGGVVHLDAVTVDAYRIMGVERNGDSHFDRFIVENSAIDRGIRYDSLAIILSNQTHMAVHSEGLINSLYACDPAVDFERVESISIVSDSDYNSLYPAGSNLAEVLSLRANRYVKFFKSLKEEPYLDESEYFLTFDLPPSRSATHNLLVTYELEDRTVTATLNNLIITP